MANTSPLPPSPHPRFDRICNSNGERVNCYAKWIKRWQRGWRGPRLEDRVNSDNTENFRLDGIESTFTRARAITVQLCTSSSEMRASPISSRRLRGWKQAFLLFTRYSTKRTSPSNFFENLLPLFLGKNSFSKSIYNTLLGIGQGKAKNFHLRVRSLKERGMEKEKLERERATPVEF